ncbi:MAG: hypothetical protein BTN85_0904 [Candidatus Methanohalarchaeum thermophilum]|uniref:Uncharacterized protein n=1 Tax=Methanohalarchaeum thermophilum TaxID=1903181 RepID=A0A1Q6DVN9_METT1|nr:MAG: hypothetical protein BTN85_0904 [Candidatus Methanohalarchaeum thermophilum]
MVEKIPSKISDFDRRGIKVNVNLKCLGNISSARVNRAKGNKPLAPMELPSSFFEEKTALPEQHYCTWALDFSAAAKSFPTRYNRTTDHVPFPEADQPRSTGALEPVADKWKNPPT